jgi:hypothetical protein
MWWECDESIVYWVACCESGCDGWKGCWIVEVVVEVFSLKKVVRIWPNEHWIGGEIDKLKSWRVSIFSPFFHCEVYFYFSKLRQFAVSFFIHMLFNFYLVFSVTWVFPLILLVRFKLIIAKFIFLGIYNSYIGAPH